MKILSPLIMAAIALCLAVLIMDILLKVPTVQFSYTTDKCVQVLPKTAGDCSNLPDRYQKQWVK